MIPGFQRKVAHGSTLKVGKYSMHCRTFALSCHPGASPIPAHVLEDLTSPMTHHHEEKFRGAGQVHRLTGVCCAAGDDDKIVIVPPSRRHCGWAPAKLKRQSTGVTL